MSVGKCRRAVRLAAAAAVRACLLSRLAKRVAEYTRGAGLGIKNKCGGEAKKRELRINASLQCVSDALVGKSQIIHNSPLAMEHQHHYGLMAMESDRQQWVQHNHQDDQLDLENHIRHCQCSCNHMGFGNYWSYKVTFNQSPFQYFSYKQLKSTNIRRRKTTTTIDR